MNDRAPTAKHSVAKKVLAYASTPVALGLLAWVIHAHGGVEVVTGVVARASTRWPLLLVPYVTGVAVTLLAYRTCLPERGREVPLPVLLLIERSGSALNAMLPLGDSSGNLIKVALLRHWYTSDQIIAAGAWGALGTGITSCLPGLGVLVAYGLGHLDGVVALLLAGAGIVASLPALLLLRLLRSGFSQRAARVITLIPSRLVARRKERILAWASGLDRHLAAAVGERRKDFYRLLGLRVLFQAVKVAELWLIVELLGVGGGFTAALLFHATNRTVTQIFAFIPGRLGILELVSASVFGALGFGPTTGVEIALMLRFSYFLNLVLSTLALSNAQAVARRYPPRAAEELNGVGLPQDGAQP